MCETLGRFLLGYYVLRRQLLVNLDENILIIKKVWKYTLVLTIMYVLLVVLSGEEIIPVQSFVLYPFLKAGVLFMAIFYATSIIQLYHKRKLPGLMQALRNLGCMTLTNYLAETVLYVAIFYGIGFGLLGEFSFGIIWLSSLLVYFLQAVFSKWWLSNYYYGPVEWLWRQLTYQKRFALKKSLV